MLRAVAWRNWAKNDQPRLEGVARWDIGLGSYPETSLKSARDLAGVKRRQVRNGIDPVEARKEARDALQASAAQLMSFADAVALARELGSIGEDKAGKAWTYTLATYAIPILGHMPISKIQWDHIAEVLQPIWTTKTRTAKDVRKLIEDVLNRPFAARNINRNNPDRRDKRLRQRPPRETKKGSNFPALPFTLTNAFLSELRKRTDTADLAVEFVIYTAASSGEVCVATWCEIDLERKLWTIPATRMKNGEEHRVHLSAPAVAILRALPHGKPDDPINLSTHRAGSARGLAMSRESTETVRLACMIRPTMSSHSNIDSNS